MISPKPKINIRAKAPRWTREPHPDVDELFAEPAPPAPPALRPEPSRRIVCTLCGTKDATQAHPEHRICTGCTDNPPAIAARIATQRAMHLRHRQQCGEAYAVAEAALDETERARWAAFCELWILERAGMASTDDTRKVKATLAAYKHPAHPKVSDALRRVWAAWEAMYWSDEGAASETKRLDVRLAEFGVCLEDMGRQAEADALYTKEAA